MSAQFDKAKNAYLVLAHEDGDMLNILVSRLLITGSVFIHIDKSSRIRITDVIEDKSVHVWKEIKVRWGGYTMVEATRLIADEAIKTGAHRLTLLSGLSYPITTDTKLMEIAKSNEDIFDGGLVDMKTTPRTFRRRFSNTHFAFHLGSGLHARLIRRASRGFCDLLPKLDPVAALYPLKLTLGSQWWSITSKTYVSAMALITNSPNIEKYFKSIECSDESFFGTLFNHVSTTHVQAGTTFVRWGGNYRPVIVQEEDLKKALQANFIFARKFSSKDLDIISKLKC
jgi:hypothetical protein